MNGKNTEYPEGEIHGFCSPQEYTRFVQFIEDQIKAGHVKEIEPDPEYGYGEMYGGRWFKDIDSGKVWRLIEPDFPFKGLWEPVEKWIPAVSVWGCQNVTKKIFQISSLAPCMIPIASIILTAEPA